MRYLNLTSELKHNIQTSKVGFPIDLWVTDFLITSASDQVSYVLREFGGYKH